MSKETLNKSGHRPIYDKILVHLDEALSGYTATPEGDYKKGFLIFKKQYIEDQSHQASEGILVAMGENAFEGLKEPPKLGDRVTFPRYAGLVVFGDDGEFYRRLPCKEIGTIHESKSK